MRMLPYGAALFIGARAGDLAYLLAPHKRNSIAYVNIKAALGAEKSPKEIKKIIRGLYRNLGEGFIELMWFPKFGKDYFDRYLEVQGVERFTEAENKGKGVIFLTAHYGNWEILNLTAALTGHPIKAIARQQKMKRLDNLLNSYRQMKGCEVIFKNDAKREVLQILRDNGRVGILGDQSAGARGIFLELFGRRASYAAGAFAFALKTECAVLPIFIINKGWGRHKIEINPPIEVKDTGDKTADITKGLEEYNKILEKYIKQHLDHWLWLHRKWKGTPSRDILILSDGKAGHLNQSLAFSQALSESDDSKIFRKKVVQVKYKNTAARIFLNVCALFSSKRCQGCMVCLKLCLTPDSYKALVSSCGDIVVSCGSSTSAVNLIYSRDVNAKRVALMKPGIFGTRRFDLVVAPKHDGLRGKNVLSTRLSLNFVNQKTLQENASRLEKSFSLDGRPKIGLLLGGDSDTYKMDKNCVKNILNAVAEVSEDLDADILASTSRRTSKDIEELAKSMLAKNKRCKMLVVANEKNIEGAVPGILGLSDAVVVSGESISMISEAISSGKRVLVFQKPEKGKHKEIIEGLKDDGFIKIIDENTAKQDIKEALKDKSVSLKTIDDVERIKEKAKQLV